MSFSVFVWLVGCFFVLFVCLFVFCLLVSTFCIPVCFSLPSFFLCSSFLSVLTYFLPTFLHSTVFVCALFSAFLFSVGAKKEFSVSSVYNPRCLPTVKNDFLIRLYKIYTIFFVRNGNYLSFYSSSCLPTFLPKPLLC